MAAILLGSDTGEGAEGQVPAGEEVPAAEVTPAAEEGEGSESFC